MLDYMLLLLQVAMSTAFGTQDRCGVSVGGGVWYLGTMEVPSKGDDTDLKEPHPQATAGAKKRRDNPNGAHGFSSSLRICVKMMSSVPNPAES